MSRWCLVLITWIGWLACAGLETNEVAVAGAREFLAAYAAWDPEGFASAATTFRKVTAEPQAPAAAFYWLGVSEFHRMLALQTEPGGKAGQRDATAAREAAVTALVAAVEADGQHAESHALLATLYGMKIGGNPLRAVRFGPKVQKHGKLALEWGAQNPRVRYLIGACRFHTARKAASLNEALAEFRQAELLFEAERRRAPRSPLEPRWGYPSCLTFLGQTHERLDQPEEAAEYFRRALAEHPADHLAAEGLKRVRERK